MKTKPFPVTAFFDEDNLCRKPGNLGVLENTFVVDFTSSYGRTKHGVVDGVEAIQGDLVIKKEDNSTVPGQEAIFPDLVCVGGNLIIDGTTISVCDFPLLRSIGGSIKICINKQLVSIDFPKLRYVSGGVIFTGNDRLESLTLPSGYIGQDLLVSNNNSLSELFFCNLVCAGMGREDEDGFCIESNPCLSNIYAPYLVHINGGLCIDDNNRAARINIGSKILKSCISKTTLSAREELDNLFGLGGLFQQLNTNDEEMIEHHQSNIIAGK